MPGVGFERPRVRKEKCTDDESASVRNNTGYLTCMIRTFHSCKVKLSTGIAFVEKPQKERGRDGYKLCMCVCVCACVTT